MNILQVNSSTGWSGGQHHVLLLSRELRRRGHKVIVACPPNSALGEVASKEGITVAPIRMPGQLNLMAILKLRKLMRQHHIDVVNTHKPLPHTLTRLAAIGLEVRIVTTRHVSFPLRSYLFSKIKWMNGVDKMIAASQSVADSLVASGIPSDKIRVIYCPLASDRFHPGVSGRSVRKEFGIGPDDPVIGQVGELRYWKGFDDFIRSCAIILKKRNDAHFLVVGRKTTSYDELARLAKDLGLINRIHFTGFRSDIEKCYAAMTVCVSASTAGEAAPYALKEPLSMGIPVVATEVGGSGEVVTDGQTGFLVPPSNPQKIAEAVLMLLDNPKLRIEMGRRGQKSVREKFSIDSAVTPTEALYQSLLVEK